MPIENEAINDVYQPIIYKSIMSPFAFRTDNPDFNRYGHLCVIGGFLAAFCDELTIVSVHAGTAYSSSYSRGGISSVLSKVSDGLYKKNELYIVFEERFLEGKPISANELIAIASKIKISFPDCELKIS